MVHPWRPLSLDSAVVATLVKYGVAIISPLMVILTASIAQNGVVVKRQNESEVTHAKETQALLPVQLWRNKAQAAARPAPLHAPNAAGETRTGRHEGGFHTMNWQEIIAKSDQSVLVMFCGVLAYALNWHVFTSPRARRVMTWVPILSSWAIMIAELLR